MIDEALVTGLVRIIFKPHMAIAFVLFLENRAPVRANDWHRFQGVKLVKVIYTNVHPL
jgi:hypothetical protein